MIEYRAIPISCATSNAHPLALGSIVPLAPASATVPPGMLAHRTSALPLPDCGSQWRAGSLLGEEAGDGENPASPASAPLFQVVGRILLPAAAPYTADPYTAGPGAAGQTGQTGQTGQGWLCPLLKTLALPPAGGEIRALAPLPPCTSAGDPEGKRHWSLAWITLSDKGAAGLRPDESGPLMAACTRARLPLSLEQGFILPDEPHALRALVMELALGQGYDLILTSGGTGLAPRDTTPEALLPLFDRRLPGFEQAMMATSLAKTPTAAISRAVAGTLYRSIVISLPGSRKAVAENLEAILPALGHALDKLHGDPRDCGR